MDLSTLSVRRPIGITMLTLIIVLFGAVSLYHLPIDLMPDITAPTISLSAQYQNAGPVEIETLLTRPIEQALSAVPGVEEITSTSTEGRCTVRVTFAWGTDLDAAANDIRDRLDRILSRLPEGVERPTLRKFDMANFPILILGASSNLDPVQMLRLIEDQVKYRIERIPGVAALDVMGGRKREIHVNLLIDRLKALQISPDQIISRIRQENLNLPAGIVEAGNYEFTIRTPGEFYRIDQLKSIVVKEDRTMQIRLGDVAEIEDKWERTRNVVRVNGKPGVRVSISKQSGKNTVKVADAVLAEIERINRDLPQIQLTPIVDTSKYIRNSINNVSSSALQGGVLAVLVLMFFLADLRSTIIIGVSIPISIIATFALMFYYGFTLNIMSLGGVALGIGMLVDNSIVVLENIFRRRERGQAPDEAAIDGSVEVTAPIIASTLTTLVIFLPLLFVEGMTGLMFKQLSYVVSFSLVCSLFVSLTLVPMLCSRLLKQVQIKNGQTQRNGISRLLKSIVGFFEDRYTEMLRIALNQRFIVTCIVLSLLGVSIYLARNIPAEFMPTADEGEVRVTVELEPGSRLSLTEEKMKQVEKIVEEMVPERLTMVTTIGGGGMGGGGGGVNRGELRLPLVDRTRRKRTSARIAGELRAALSQIPGIRVRTREGQGLFIFRMGANNADKIQVQVRGHNLEQADRLAKQVQNVLKAIPGISDIQLSRESGVPERLISIDRQRASDQRLTVTRVAQFLETLLSGTGAGNFRESGDEYRILVKALSAERLLLEDIMDLTILNALGQPVVLRNLAGIVSREGPLLIERADQERVVNVSADPGERSVGEVLNEVQAALKTIPLPNGFSLALAGDFEERRKAFKELLISFCLALILVFMVMAIQYESLKDPVIVMVTVPLSVIGVVVALVATGTTFNVQAFIGCIMLGGIVVNNSILLVDHANDLYRTQNRPLMEALLEAGRDRFRPVLMTAATTILGLVPMALGLGEGGEVQAPMARVVMGGLICATCISLGYIPVVYSVFAGFEARQPAQQDKPNGELDA